MSTFTGSSVHGSDGDGDGDGGGGGFVGYDPRFPSQRFESSFSDFADTESAKESVDDSVPVFGTNEDTLSSSRTVPESPLPAMFLAEHGAPSDFSSDHNGGVFGESNGPILPPPEEFPSEEGFALREWRRLNAIRLEEKEKAEKEVLEQIIEEAEEFKREFYQKRQIGVENRKASNREKETQVVASQESFHAEAPKNYWKAIAELIPYEVPTIVKRGKKEKEKQPSVTVIRGPKPGKPTDMSRMRHILVKLKHSPPPHMKLEGKEVKAGPPSSASAAAPTSASAAPSPPSKAAVNSA